MPPRAATAAHGMRGTLRSVGRLDTTAGKVVLRMSVGVNSGTFHFFLVGESHREFMVTGPAASRTVDMESTATAGEILLSRDTAAALPSKVLGQPKGEGILLRSGPATLPFQRDDVEVPITSIDIAQAIPVALREHLVSGATEPEHRTATIAFVHFDGVDDLVETRGVDVLAAGPARADRVRPARRARTTASRSSARTSITTAARSSSSRARRTRWVTTRAGCCSRSGRSSTRRRRCRSGSV